MDIAAVVHEVEALPSFRSWLASHRSAFLASVLVLFDSSQEDDPKLNYYDGNEEKMSTFSTLAEAPRAGAILKKSGALQPVDVSAAVSLGAARKAAFAVYKKQYSAERIIRGLAVLQVLDGKQMWNVTFITANYRTINVRVDSSSGNVLSHSVDSLVEFIPGKRRA